MAESTLCRGALASSSSSSSPFSKSRSRSSLPFPAFKLASCDMHHNFTRELTWVLSTQRRASAIHSPRVHTQLHQDQPSTIPADEGIKWWERDWGATLADVHSTQELNDIVATADGKLVIVEFFASWCGSCRALYPKLCKLAVEHEEVVFVKVNFDENKALCKSLNIKVLPYFHLYRGELEQLDSFSCSITKLQKLKDAIAKYGISDHSRHGPSSLSSSVTSQ